jgi:hypothetical protein
MSRKLLFHWRFFSIFAAENTKRLTNEKNVPINRRFHSDDRNGTTADTYRDLPHQ